MKPRNVNEINVTDNNINMIIIYIQYAEMLLLLMTLSEGMGKYIKRNECIVIA